MIQPVNQLAWVPYPQSSRPESRPMLLGLLTLCPGQVGLLELPQQASCIQYQQEGGREEHQVVSSSHWLVFLRILELRISPIPLILQAYGH